jgi:hypothetical protein
VILSKHDVTQVALTNFSYASKHDDKLVGFRYYDNNPAFGMCGDFFKSFSLFFSLLLLLLLISKKVIEIM